jgi:hypothetical protein
MSFSDFARKADLFQNELKKYFLCELRGHDPLNPCDRSSFETLESDTLTILTFMFSGMLPVANLIFTISVQGVKNKCRVIRGKMKSISLSNTKNTVTGRVESKEMSQM